MIEFNEAWQPLYPDPGIHLTIHPSIQAADK